MCGRIETSNFFRRRSKCLDRPWYSQLIANSFILAAGSREREHLVQRVYYREHTPEPSLAPYFIIRVGITRTHSTGPNVQRGRRMSSQRNHSARNLYLVWIPVGGLWFCGDGFDPFSVRLVVTAIIEVVSLCVRSVTVLFWGGICSTGFSIVLPFSGSISLRGSLCR